MEDNLIGKRFQYKGSNDVKTIKDVKNNRVYFTDNGSIDLAKMYESFIEIQTPKINPDTFFDKESNLTSNFGSMLNQIEQLQKDPEGFSQQNNAERNNDYLPPLSANGQDMSGISPETLRNYEQSQRDAQKRAAEAEEARKNDPWLKAQLQNGEMGEIRRVDATDNINELEYINKVNNGEINPNITPPPNKSNTPVNNQMVNSNPSLPKMKKTFKIKLKLELNEMIPKVEDIRAVENLFDISLIDDIAKEIANKYFNDRELLENMIISELDKIIKPKKKPKKATVKTVAKKTVSKVNEA